MTATERLEAIFERTDETITRLRLIRSLAQKGKMVDASDLNDLQSLIDSLRHHVEMNNQERLCR